MCYHLVSRVANRAFYFSEDERTRLVERMWRVARFSCVHILSYCVMGNHFHILAYVPPPRELSEDDILSRVRSLYAGDKLDLFEKEWKTVSSSKDAASRKRFLGRFTKRMWSASEFMKTFKQLSSQSFNARRRHAGTMWESRFRARMIRPDAKPELMIAAGYIDRNPVKAKIVDWPDGYKWCGFAAACAGDARCREGYRFIYNFAMAGWQQVKKLHERSIGIALKELEDDPEARSAAGSQGGDKFSVSAEKLESIRRRRREEVESAMPDMLPRILERGSNRIARDILAALAEGPRRPGGLRDELGITSANYFTSHYVTPMVKAGLIKPAGTASRHSPNLSYMLTAKGRRALQ